MPRTSLAVLAAAVGFASSSLAQAAVTVIAQGSNLAYSVHAIGPATGPLPSISFEDIIANQDAFGRRYDMPAGQFSFFVPPAEEITQQHSTPVGGGQLIPSSSSSIGGLYKHGSISTQGGADPGVSMTITHHNMPGRPDLDQAGFLDMSFTAGGAKPTNFVLAPRSYVTFTLDSAVGYALTGTPAGAAARQDGSAVVSLKLHGSGPDGDGQQSVTSSNEMTILDGSILEQRRERRLTASFFNNTDAPMAGLLSLNVRAMAQLNQPAVTVPEPQGLALLLGGAGVVLAAVRRRRKTAAALAATAGLSGLAGPALAADSAGVTADLVFSDITLTVSDMDPGDAYLPTLTMRAPGSFGNSGSASVSWRKMTDWVDQSDVHWSEPQADGGLFSVGGAQAGSHGGTSSVEVQADPQAGGEDPRLALRAGAPIPGPAEMIVSHAMLDLGPTYPFDEMVPHYSFTIGARSYATFSMHVEAGMHATGLDGLTATGGALVGWSVTMMHTDKVYSSDVQSVTGNGFLEFTAGTDQGMDKRVSYSLFNAGTEAMNVALYLHGDVQAYTMRVPDLEALPSAPVPEPETWAMVMAGVALVAASRRTGRRA